MVARILALILLAATSGAQTVFVTTNNYNTLNPETDALSGPAGSFRITHTITDGSSPVSFEFLESPINLRVVDRQDSFTNYIRSAFVTNDPGTVRWTITNLTAGSYTLYSEITLGGDTFPVFWRYLTVTSAAAPVVSVTVTNILTSNISVTNGLTVTNVLTSNVNVTNELNSTFSVTNNLNITNVLQTTFVVTNVIDPVESDPVWVAASTGYLKRVESATSYVASVTGTSAVNGAITFAGIGVTQTGSIFNFSGSGSVQSPTNQNGAIALAGSTGLVWSGAYTASAYNAFVMMTPQSNIIYAPFVPVPKNPYTNKQIFSFTATTQSFVVPAGVTSLWAKLWGAGGGNPGAGTPGTGGFSSYVHQTTPGETLLVIVGSTGTITSAAFTNNFGTNAVNTGGWPNGGNCADSSTNNASAGGGGWSALFRGTNLLQASGGGGGSGGSNGQGGNGGGISGSAGSASSAVGGTGGSQISGGITNGAIWLGGNGITITNGTVGGGGGGFYGGGGGTATGTGQGGGGGGSGYIPDQSLGANIIGNNSTDTDWVSPYGAAGANGAAVLRW